MKDIDHTLSNPTDLRRDKIGIALGSFGYNLGSAVLMTYLTFFLTDNMLIAAGSVSLILLFSRIIDAFTDLWVGSCVDKTKSKMGKARPWLIWMAPPAIISMGLLFTIPNFNETGRIIYAFITYNLVAFFYLTALALPANALVALITTDNKKRMGLSQIWGFFLTLGAVVVNYISTPLMTLFGGGNAGYFWFFTLMAAVGCIFMILCSVLVKERVNDEIDESRVKKISFKTGFKAIANNKYWWLVMLINVITSLIPSCLGAIPYYCIYWMRGAVDTGQLMALFWGGITVGVLLFIPVTRKIGKAKSSAIGVLIQAFGTMMLLFAPESVPMLWISTVFRSVGVGGLSGNISAMIADVVEYGEWKTGVRAEGMIYSGASFGTKVGSGLGGALVSGLLAWGMYIPQAAEQLPKAMTAIKLAFVVAPLVASIIVAVLCMLFRIEKIMPQIKADLDAKTITS